MPTSLGFATAGEAMRAFRDGWMRGASANGRTVSDEVRAKLQRNVRTGDECDAAGVPMKFNLFGTTILIGEWRKQPHLRDDDDGTDPFAPEPGDVDYDETTERGDYDG